MDINDKAQFIAKCKGSFLFFLRSFYQILNAREFQLSHPISRESHYITIARELVACQRLQSNRLLINLPPGYGKSTMLVFWIAWCFIHNPDSRFLYISVSQSLSAMHTDTLRRIMMLIEYEELFNVCLRKDSRAKEFFQTIGGGYVVALGADGTIVGKDAGYPGLDRFSGAAVIDDAHNPKEAHSDTVRESIITNYRETIQIRVRDPKNVPIIFLGQRVHEADLGAYLIAGNDGYNWKKVILPGLDEANQPLWPERYPLEWHQIKKEKDPYFWAAQVQQNPSPAGGALFKEDDFLLLEEDPEMLVTFICADTAETEKSFNDATAFGFFGLYYTEQNELAVHCIHGIEIRVEPCDLEETFMQFYAACRRYPVPPRTAFIEKKSTGTTLVSVLKKLQGIKIWGLERTVKSGSKTARFLNVQTYIAQRRFTFTEYAKHTRTFIEHLVKITANNTHAHDDIADVCTDAITKALIEEVVAIPDKTKNNDLVKKMMQQQSNFIDAGATW